MRTIGNIAIGIAVGWLILFGVAAACMSAVRLLDSLFPAPPAPMLVQADFPTCVTIVPPPIIHPRADKPFARKADNT